jgi:hypothetical protein
MCPNAKTLRVANADVIRGLIALAAFDAREPRPDLGALTRWPTRKRAA